MSLRARKPVIFIFVLGAVAVGALMAYYFGGSEYVSRHTSFLVYFGDTVNGLEPGSEVAFKGVPIGYVDSIRLDYQQPGDHHIPVLIKLNLDRLKLHLGVTEDWSDPAVLDAQIRRGLRADMDVDRYATGSMLVELEYHTPAPKIEPAACPPSLPPIPIIPALPSSAVANLNEAQDILAWLPTFDFPREADKIANKIDAVTTVVSAIPYAEDSQLVQRTVRPLVRMSQPAFDRGLDNFLARLNRFQGSLAIADQNFISDSGDFVRMNHDLRSQLGGVTAGLADTRDQLQPSAPSLEHLTHNLQQLTKDMQNLTGKLNAMEGQPDVVNKVAH